MGITRRAALALGVAAAFPGHGHAQVPGNASGLPWRSGYRPSAARVDALRAFEAWRGRRCDLTLLFVGNESWQTWDTMLQAGALNNVGRAFHAAGYPLIFSLPLIQRSDAGNFGVSVVDGHRRLATKLAALVGGQRCYVRLGWEANRGYHWSYARHGGSGPDPARAGDYKSCWRSAAAMWRAYCPSARLVWNHLKFPDRRAEIITDYYPGDDVVDVLAINPYDNGAWGYGDSAAGFAESILGYRGSFNGWDPRTGRCLGLNGMRQFAQSRGKTLGLCEWAPTNPSQQAANRANNSYYARAIFDFCRQYAGSIEYECFFGSGAQHQIYPRVAHNARASDAYRAAWLP